MHILLQLEARLLLSFVGVRDRDILAVEATPGDDQITVSVAPDPRYIRVQINGDAPVDWPYVSRRGGNISIVHIDAGAGDDNLRVLGRPVRDVELLGGDGNDTMQGDGDAFYGNGGDGDDIIQGSGSREQNAYGGPGSDRITLSGSANAIIDGGSGNDIIISGSGNDRIWGGRHADTIVGGGGDDSILGGRGDDALSGGEGDDWIFGQAGNDTLNGEAGNDHLFGGGGADLLADAAGGNWLRSGGEAGDVIDGSAVGLVRGREYRRFERLFGELGVATVPY